MRRLVVRLRGVLRRVRLGRRVVVRVWHVRLVHVRRRVVVVDVRPCAGRAVRAVPNHDPR